MTNKQPTQSMEEVELAEEGTLLAKFQKDRTDAISEMFNRDKDCGRMHTTSQFFAKLDDGVRQILALSYTQGRKDMAGEMREAIDENIKINQMTHRVGSHSDDYGGESDYPCDCDNIERGHRISELESIKKMFLALQHEEGKE